MGLLTDWFFLTMVAGLLAFGVLTARWRDAVVRRSAFLALAFALTATHGWASSVTWAHTGAASDADHALLNVSPALGSPDGTALIVPPGGLVIGWWNADFGGDGVIGTDDILVPHGLGSIDVLVAVKGGPLQYLGTVTGTIAGVDLDTVRPGSTWFWLYLRASTCDGCGPTSASLDAFGVRLVDSRTAADATVPELNTFALVSSLLFASAAWSRLRVHR